jgi:ABC-type uncharacterized transport system permease subunit
VLLLATLLYLSATALLARTHPLALPRLTPVALALLASILHAILLIEQTFPGDGFLFAFYNTLSLTAWLAATLITLAAIGRPVERLGVIIYPLALIAMIAAHWFGDTTLATLRPANGLLIHIGLSLTSYSILTLAAVQAIMLAFQNHALRHHKFSGMVRHLPSLDTMEQMLFQLIAIGYLLLSGALIAGAYYLENIFAQHLVHKTVLALLSWTLFATLLWGRWRFGWRGKTAVRWTLGGFIALALAFFGSKLVLELLLGTSN